MTSCADGAGTGQSVCMRERFLVMERFHSGARPRKVTFSHTSSYILGKVGGQRKREEREVWSRRQDRAGGRVRRGRLSTPSGLCMHPAPSPGSIFLVMNFLFHISDHQGHCGNETKRRELISLNNGLGGGLQILFHHF